MRDRTGGSDGNQSWAVRNSPSGGAASRLGSVPPRSGPAGSVLAGGC
jgi:hypothetical protein